MFSCDKIACCTLFWYFRSEKEKLGRVSLSFYFLFNFLGDVQGSPSEASVATCHAPTLPPMIIHHLNIAVITWSNFEAGIDVNGIIVGVTQIHSSIDIMNVSTGVNIAVVKLRGGGMRSCDAWFGVSVVGKAGAGVGFRRLMF
jgi:hypothetical protein